MNPTFHHIIYTLCSAILFVSTPACAQTKTPKSTEKVSNDSITVIRQQADNGNPSAQNTLGLWYYNGENVSKDYQLAFRWWQKAAEQHHISAIGNLGLCYQYGRGTVKDSLKAIHQYEQSIGKGNVPLLRQHEKAAEQKKSCFSAKLLRECYANGIGVRRDPEKALQYMKLLDQMGHEETSYELAVYYINHAQPNLAFPIFKRLASAGHTGATYYCGNLLLKGSGVREDKAQGIAYLKEADNKGFQAASYLLGETYLYGNGVEKDEATAVKYFEKAVPFNAAARWALAECYRKGMGCPVNFTKALPLYADVYLARKKDFKALIQNDHDGHFTQYLRGLKLKEEGKLDDAMDIFNRLGNKKSADVTLQKACILADKNYKKSNAKKAAKMLSRLTDSIPLASFYLSQLYEEGNGVKKDKSMAINCLSAAAEAGETEAQRKLAALYMDGIEIPQNYAKAAEYYLRIEAYGRLSQEDTDRLIRLYEMKISALPDADKAEQRIKELKRMGKIDKIAQLLKSVR